MDDVNGKPLGGSGIARYLDMDWLSRQPDDAPPRPAPRMCECCGKVELVAVWCSPFSKWVQSEICESCQTEQDWKAEHELGLENAAAAALASARAASGVDGGRYARYTERDADALRGYPREIWGMVRDRRAVGGYIQGGRKDRQRIAGRLLALYLERQIKEHRRQRPTAAVWHLDDLFDAIKRGFDSRADAVAVDDVQGLDLLILDGAGEQLGAWHTDTLRRIIDRREALALPTIVLGRVTYDELARSAPWTSLGLDLDDWLAVRVELAPPRGRDSNSRGGGDRRRRDHLEY